jgi:hypothetical protein
MSQSAGSWSLWLKPPPGPTAKKLAQEVAAQAKAFGGHLFEPHVTLLGGISGGKSYVLKAAEQLAGQLKVCWPDCGCVVQLAAYRILALPTLVLTAYRIAAVNGPCLQAFSQHM